jgi:glycosyltransferase involved in cell wall biosynthesis
MATYNGAAHLEDQIRSLQAQDFRAWRLFVRDDGSSDGTPERLATLAGADSRISVLPTERRLGVIENFGELFWHAHREGAARVFLCDQDDVWHPTKITRTLAVMTRLEAEHGSEAPLLVHSDLEVVDESLHPLGPSFLRYQGLAHQDSAPLTVLLVQNFVTGCAMAVNRALLDLALPIPDGCIMHDWWLALCAAARGRIGFIPDALIRYRQHGRNQLGAGGSLGALNVLEREGRERFARSWEAIRQSLSQARLLEERLRERGGAAPRVLELVGAFSRLERDRPAIRLWKLARLGIHCHRPLGTAFLFARMGLMPASPSPRP